MSYMSAIFLRYADAEIHHWFKRFIVDETIFVVDVAIMRYTSYECTIRVVNDEC